MAKQTEKAGESSLCIVVGLAFNAADGAAFDQAVSIASGAGRSELHLVHVFEEEPAKAQTRELIDHLRLYVNEKAAAAGGLKGITVGIHIRTGKPVRELAQFASDLGANLIVIGSHKGPHLKSWLVGSTAEQLIARATCPVLVAAPKPSPAQPEEPAIEPACPDCLKTRAATRGASWWCDRHSHRGERAHTFSYQRELPLATYDSEVIPTGIQF